jgi:hypothetical protein
MASSVCGEVGFAAIEVLWREERVLLVLVGLEGACRRRNLMSRGVSVDGRWGGTRGERRRDALPGVMKQET